MNGSCHQRPPSTSTANNLSGVPRPTASFLEEAEDKHRTPVAVMHQPPRDQQLPAAATAPIPPSFARRKEAILAQLAVPDDEYTDLSPKGTVDAGIRDLIDEINGIDGLVTTSSCAGRVSVFLEGRRAGRGADEGSLLLLPGHHLAVEEGAGEDGDEGHERGDGAAAGAVRAGATPVGVGNLGDELPAMASASTDTVAGVGGKGGGGRWLFVSHEPVESRGKLDSEPNIVAALLGIEEPIFDGREGSSAEEMGESRLIHFKFEPMVCLLLLFISPEFYICCRVANNQSLRSYMSLRRLLSTPSSFSVAAYRLASARAAPLTSSRRQPPPTTHQRQQRRPSWRSAPWAWGWRA